MAFSTLWGPQQKGIVLDGFAGPGGWSEGLLLLGVDGSTLSEPRTTPDLIRKRFERRIRVMPNGCWEWTGVRTARGYGRVRIGKREYGAHRVALVIASGKPLAEGDLACHRCDNPPCVNPAHLFHGTPKDNMHDMDAKGRRVIVANRGTKNGCSKLTEADVRWIRTNTEVRAEDAAESLGVSASLIRQVRRGAAWGWVA